MDRESGVGALGEEFDRSWATIWRHGDIFYSIPHFLTWDRKSSEHTECWEVAGR